MSRTLGSLIAATAVSFLLSAWGADAAAVAGRPTPPCLELPAAPARSPLRLAKSPGQTPGKQQGPRPDGPKYPNDPCGKDLTYCHGFCDGESYHMGCECGVDTNVSQEGCCECRCHICDEGKGDKVRIQTR